MADEYDAIRHRLSNYERGLYFELGRAHICGETPENGWVRQFEIIIDGNRRVLDSASTQGKGVRAVERKSGQINEIDALRQLALEREALQSGQLTHSTWEIVAGEKVPPAVTQELQSMAKDFPGQFQHVVISRAEAVRAIQLGQTMRAKQMELVSAYALDRADRARKRLARIKQLVLAREAKNPEEKLSRTLENGKRNSKEVKGLSATITDKNMQIAQAQENFRAIDPTEARQDHKTAAKKLQEVRAKEKAQTKDMLQTLGVTGENARIMEQILAQGRENQRHELIQGIEAIGQAADREAQAQAAREAALAWQRQQMELAKQRGYAPELQAIMELMNQGRPAPGVALPGAPAEAPEVTRDGRAKQHALELAKRQGLEPRGPR
ncbi:hypothetical protein ACFYTQ_26440 [Nocardia sp. NPDC004068]|uniref:hypothetical protein n=1 Tax=Nocardia sp. NPDC004068 TaxID=3364303 RepID=UPI0036786CF6